MIANDPRLRYSMSSDDRNAPRNISPWKNAPTPIPTPSGDSRSQTNLQSHDECTSMTAAAKSDPHNPFGGKRTTSNLEPRRRGRGYTTGNRTANSTITRKKAQLDPRKKPRLAPENVVGSSDDELDGLASFAYHPQRNRSHPDASNDDEIYAFDRDSDGPRLNGSNAIASTSRVLEDGPATRSLTRMLDPLHDRSISPIEEFIDPSRPTSKVKSIVSSIEANGNQGTMLVDLRRLKSRMKPKTPSDPIATSSSNFHRRDRPYYFLPLKGCYIGGRLINGTFINPIYLVWNPSDDNFYISCREIGERNALINLERERHLDAMEYTPSSLALGDGMPVVKLVMRLGSRVVVRDEPTIRGSTLEVRSITLKLNKGDKDWRPAYYDQFITWVKQKVSGSISRNAKEMWEVAERTLVSEDVVDSHALKKPTTKSPLGFKTPDSRSRGDTTPDVPDIQESEAVNDQPLGPRRSARIRTTVKKPIIPVDPDEVILIYPQGVPGAINITNADVSRLQPGEFLNDTIIEFGLKLWHRDLEDSNPELAKQVHVFSSFFYKKLNKKNFEEGYDSIRKWTNKINLFEKKYIIIPINEHLHWYLAIIYMPEYILQPPTSPPSKQGAASRTRSRASLAAKEADDGRILAESGSSAISSPAAEENEFSQHLDEFSCTVTVAEDNSPDGMEISSDRSSHEEDHLASIVPQPMDDFAMDVDKSEEDAVQEQLRLFSPTISELGMDRRNNDNLGVEKKPLRDQNNIVLSRFFSKDVEISVVELDSQGQQITDTSINDVHLDDLNQEELDEEMQEKQDGSDTSQRTYIFTLDSLGTRHPQATRQLSRYLKKEALDKLGNSNTSDAINKMVPVPTQPNFCDCGVYLLHFAKTFMTNPATYFKTIVTESKKSLPVNRRQTIWEDHKVGTMRQELEDRIRTLSKKWKEERAAKGEEKKGQVETIKESDSSDIEYVDTAPARAQGKAKAVNDGTTKKPKSSRMRG